MKTWSIYLKNKDDIFNLEGFEKARGFADPFLFRDYIFYENRKGLKGRIAYYNIKTEERGIAIEADYHISFPCIFEDSGNIYMVPETLGNASVELWQSTSFPHSWKKIKVILSHCPPADPVIHKHNGNFYLFVTMAGDNNLEIWKSDSLLGEWKLNHRGQYWHSRSAGHIFEYDNKLIRPVQNNKDSYGGGLIFKEITLEPYSEKEYKRIEPINGALGIHTFNFNDKYQVIDLKYETSVDSIR